MRGEFNARTGDLFDYAEDDVLMTFEVIVQQV